MKNIVLVLVLLNGLVLADDCLNSMKPYEKLSLEGITTTHLDCEENLNKLSKVYEDLVFECSNLAVISDDRSRLIYSDIILQHSEVQRNMRKRCYKKKQKYQEKIKSAKPLGV